MAHTEDFFETRDRLRALYGRSPRTGHERGTSERSLEFMADTTRSLLSDAIRARFGGAKRWAFVRDFDDNYVIYTVETETVDGFETNDYRLTYTINTSGRVTLGDSPEEIRAATIYIPLEQSRAFLTEVDGKTILTAPASSLVQRAAASPNPHFLEVAGRFVGADKPNRNGAMWTLDDLEMGEPTVQHGPLNWLHEDRHIIGTITEASLQVPSTTEKSKFTIADPFIEATAAVWRWLWPEEAKTIEKAASTRSLWYSMECISESVVCTGPNGCGQEYAYFDVVRASRGEELDVCQHVLTRASVRRFKDPTFLGGAIIVPPVRPGWKDANVDLLRQGARFAEAAFDQAGRPDVTPDVWDTLMAQVVDFATS